MIKIYKITLILLALLMSVFQVNAQRERAGRMVSLKEFVSMVQRNNINVRLAQMELSNSLLEQSNFELSTKPTLVMNSTLPNFVRAVDAITQPDGTEVFLNRSLMNNTVNMALEKTFLQTGGTLSVGTGMERLDIFSTNTVSASNTYAFNAIEIGFTQPLFQFNELKWDAKIADLKAQENYYKRIEAMANAEFEAANLFFQLLEQQKQLEATQNNLATYRKLVQDARAKLELGSVKKLDLLQLQIDLNNLRQDSSRAVSRLDNARDLMNELVGNTTNERWTANWADQRMPGIDLDLNAFIDKIKKHPRLLATAATNRATAEKELDRAKKRSGVQLNLQLNFGLNQISNQLGDFVGGRYLDQERVFVELSVPIYDWGKRASSINLAEKERDYQELLLESEQNQALNQVIDLFNQYQIARKDHDQLQEVIGLFQEKYEVALQQFSLGKIDAQLLSLALNDLDRKRLELNQTFIQMWRLYFELNKWTLFNDTARQN